MDLEEVHGEGGRISTKYRELPVIFFAWGRGVGYIGGTFLSKILYFDVVFLFNLLHTRAGYCLEFWYKLFQL